MKRVNIKRDVDSRAKIGTTHQPFVPQETPVAEPQIQPQEDAQSQENRIAESDEVGTTEKPQKRGRSPKGNAEEVSLRAD